MPDTLTLPESVTICTIADRTVYLVGTAHVSQSSVDDVRATVEAVKPDTIAIELCDPRYRSLVERNAWQKMDVFKVLREGKAVLLLAQLLMSAFYRKLGEQLGTKPGAEMLAGAELADQTGATLVLADRSIEITLKRVWGYLSFWNRMRLAWSLFGGILAGEDIDADMIEDLKNRDQFEAVMEEFTRVLPQVKERLIDERDIYLAEKIRRAEGSTVVAVVGAGHVPGIVQHIQTDHPLEPLETIPPPSLLPRLLKWGIPLAIVALFAYGAWRGGGEDSMRSIYIWVLVNGTLSALGAAIALGHPLTVLSAFLAAPLTSLNPFMAAGWVAGVVQAWARKPTVADFEDIPNATATFKGFWLNPVVRILLVTALANLGSSLGTFISGGWIAAVLFG